MAKLTKREQILQFVESQGTATFTQIQRFIVDLNYGAGTYDKGAKAGFRSVWNGKNGAESRFRAVPANVWRGYYCGAFCGGSSTRRTADGGYKRVWREPSLLNGKDRLVKSGKLYKTVRGFQD